MRGATLALLCLLLGGIGSGCGYSTQSSLDPHYQTIFVSAFHDQTPEYGLQAPLTNAVIRKFTHDNRLRVVREEEADLLLEGVILDYQLRGLTFDGQDRVTQFLAVITAGVRLKDRRDGAIVWQEPKLSGETTFYTLAAGQSSDRLRGNAEVFLSPVRSFNSEEENRAAAEALEQLASDIFYRTVEPW